MQQNYTFYLCKGHAIALPEAPKLKIKLTCVSVLFQSLCLYFFAGWNMPGHSQACEAWPLAREDCSFHWCAAQSALECTGELGTENASESTGSKAQVIKKTPNFFWFQAQAGYTQCTLFVESSSLAINLITQQKHKELLCMFCGVLNLFTFPEYIVTVL